MFGSAEEEQEEEQVEPSPVYLGNEQEKYKNNPLQGFQTRFIITSHEGKLSNNQNQQKFISPVTADLKTLNPLYDMITSHRDTNNLKVLHMFQIAQDLA